MMLGNWSNSDSDECLAMVHEAHEAGINFVDTADVYSYGESEELLGKAIRRLGLASLEKA